MRRWSILLAAVGLATLATAPAVAAEMMMKKGETVMMMPNGRIDRVMHTDKMMSETMMKNAKPMDGCVVMMMGADGKMYMMNDMKMSNGKMACATH
ncbi:hypothetical protein [Kaistia terrae]|uniref:Uncharacterized protein n=1 Tax=Kaistia terrae TaxID=537017 RepID=A0ABW0PS04_9HYPH|nr:hypothetical protein [Kaistia terrae]MCX5578064.1 hypothetical protein [Kaistia terrae]